MALTCKNCGGNIVFDKENFKFVCDSCGRLHTDIDNGDNVVCNGEKTTVEDAETYRRALRAMETAVSENMFTMAAILFDRVRGFSDSADKAQECRFKAAELRKERLYRSALDDMDSKDPERIAKAGEVFTSLKDYMQSAENALKCEELYKIAVKNQPKPEIVVSKKTKKRKKSPVFIVILLIIAVLVTGVKLWGNAVYSANNISVRFAPQEDNFLEEYSNRYVFNFSVTLKNSGTKDVEEINGIVAFIDKKGNAVVDTEVSFYGSPIAVRHGKSSKYSWELTVYSEETAKELFCTDFEDFDIEFEAKTIRFSNGKTVWYE